MTDDMTCVICGKPYDEMNIGLERFGCSSCRTEHDLLAKARAIVAATLRAIDLGSDSDNERVCGFDELAGLLGGEE